MISLAQFCGGCGLLWLPALETVPSPVRKVAVRDENTRAIIPSAGVTCRIISVDTKTDLFHKSEFHLWDEPREVGRISVTRENGLFVLHGRLLLAGWQDLWPLFSWATAGDWHYHGYRAKIVVSARGYVSEEVEFPSDASPSEFAGVGHGFQKGTLTFYLVPLHQPAASSCSSALLQGK